MTQTYRTDDLAKWLTGKGSDLTPAEVDNNFWDIIQRLITIEALPSAAAGIDHFSVSGTQFYVIMTDATTLGPYELPQFDFLDRGDWAPSTSYAINDVFTINGGLYRVPFPHTSALTFDAGANDGLGHDYYRLWFQTPGSSLPTGGSVDQVLQKSTTADYAAMWGWKLPVDGTTRQYLIKQSATNQDAEWDTPQAEDIEFTPVTGSTLTSTNVADALEELSDGIIGTADGIEYTPSTGSGLTDTTVADALDTLGSRNPIGKQTMWIPAASMMPRTTNGATPNTIELTANKIMVRTNDFDTTTQEYVQFDVAMPNSWDGGAVTFRAYWSHPTTSVNFGVAFGLEAVGISNGNPLDVSFGTSIYVTDTGGTFDDIYVSDESAAVTVSGSVTFPALILFQVCRNPANGSDNLAVDARLHGIHLYYTTDTATDA